MGSKPDLIVQVDIDRLNSLMRTHYNQEPNPLIEWLEEYIGPKQNPTLWPCSGEHWKCWLAYDPSLNFELTWCQVEIDSSVDDSIISLFVLQWT